MALTNKDPHNARELAATVILAARIVRRQERGKSTKRLEQRVERIREDAQKREDSRSKKK
ncbi:hypothetical protein ABZ341_17035 [Streptomyces sp. NPDC006173]|uniref:hypothetical protein n=1 Tax=Streptomyces sp. NPDC006173 TaxID=3155349 RepID=UPI0033D268CA